MKAEEFDAILERRIELMRKVLGAKAKEYASDKDRLHNFKETVTLGAKSPADGLIGMLRKHVISLIDIVEDSHEQNEAYYVSEALLDEKIGDTCNYVVLLEAILRERFGMRITPLKSEDGVPDYQ